MTKSDCLLRDNQPTAPGGTMSNLVLATEEQFAGNDNQPQLIKYEAACRAIAEARMVDEVKHIHGAADAMRAYAKQAKNKQIETDAAEIRIRAERRIGELMAAQRDAGLLSGGTRGQLVGPGVIGGTEMDPPIGAITLTEVGIDKHLADRARKLAAIPSDEFDDIVTDWRDRIEQENERVTVNLLKSGEKHSSRLSSYSGDNEWYTPAKYIEMARTVMGQIDVDPASNDHAQKTVKAATYYTAETNGLDKEWNGTVWMNPPYSNPEIQNFVNKVITEHQAGRCTEAIVLTNNSGDTGWCHALKNAAKRWCVTKGRIRFESTTRESGAGAMGQIFFYFGNDEDRFKDVFREIGTVEMAA